MHKLHSKHRILKYLRTDWIKTLESKLRLLPITDREPDDKGGEILAVGRMVNSEKEM